MEYASSYFQLELRNVSLIPNKMWHTIRLLLSFADHLTICELRCLHNTARYTILAIIASILYLSILQPGGSS